MWMPLFEGISRIQLQAFNLGPFNGKCQFMDLISNVIRCVNSDFIECIGKFEAAFFSV